MKINFKKIISEFLPLTTKNKVLLAAWKELKEVIEINFKNPDINYTIDCTKKNIGIFQGKSDRTTIKLKLSCIDFHNIYTGKLNVLEALSKRKLIVDGNLEKVMKLASSIPESIKLYGKYLNETYKK